MHRVRLRTVAKRGAAATGRSPSHPRSDCARDAASTVWLPPELHHEPERRRPERQHPLHAGRAVAAPHRRCRSVREHPRLHDGHAPGARLREGARHPERPPWTDCGLLRDRRRHLGLCGRHLPRPLRPPEGARRRHARPGHRHGRRRLRLGPPLADRRAGDCRCLRWPGHRTLHLHRLRRHPRLAPRQGHGAGGELLRGGLHRRCPLQPLHRLALRLARTLLLRRGPGPHRDRRGAQPHEAHDRAPHHRGQDRAPRDHSRHRGSV